MSNEIDWSKAPEGATHFSPVNGLFYRENGICFDAFSAYSWIYTGRDRSKYPGLIPRPVQWDGAGLPPVGTVCENRVGSYWKEVLILTHDFVDGKKIAVFRLGREGHASYFGDPAEEFRPIRTAEQIAAEEREAAIAEMTVLSPLLDKGWSRRVCEAVYDAGYRKPSAK